MAENRTDLVIRAKAEGFQQVQQKAAAISNEAAKAVDQQISGFKKIQKSTKAFQNEVKSLEGALDGLAKQQLVTMRAMDTVGKGTDEYKKLKEVVKELNDQYTVQERRLQATNRALKNQAVTAKDMAKGGLLQGLLQGGLPELGNIQRGPGMGRQVAGQMIGKAARGVPGAMFGGVGGMSQALAGIPIVGGMLSGQLNTAMGFAEGALGLQRQQLEAAPLIAGGGQAAKIRAARARGRAGVAAPEGGFLSQEQISSRAEAMRRSAEATAPTLTEDQREDIADTVAETQRAFARTRAAEKLAQFEGGPTDFQRKIIEGSEQDRAKMDVRERKKLTDMLEYDAVGKERKRRGQAAADDVQRVLSSPERQFNEARDAAGSRAAARQRRRPFEGLYGAGLQYGAKSQQESLQTATGVLQRGGGTMADLKAQGMTQAMFAAETAYGVGGDISGAFLQAGRRGGAVGAEGRGGEAMADSIGEAMAMGLEGSEVNDYLSQVAQGIQAFQQTGIPINTRTLTALGKEVAGAGLGGVRGRVIAGGLQRAGQGLTERGIQGSTDLLMAQTMGGFKGGGMEDYEAAMMKLESGDFKGPELQQFVSKLMKAGGGGATGRQVVRQAFGSLGVKMGVKETKAFTGSVMGEDLSPAQQADASKIREQMARGTAEAPKGVAGLTSQAKDIMDAYGGAVKRAADLQNKQNAVGAKMLKPMQDLQSSSLAINGAFTKLASGGLSDLTGKIEGLALKIEKVTERMEKFGAWQGWSEAVTF